MKYDVRTYWTDVATRIQARGSHNFLAGDDTPYYAHKRQKFLQEFRRINFNGKSVLEVGCGPGGNLEIAHSLNPRRLIGCDISQKMIDLSADNLKDLLPDIELRVTDGVNLPFPDKSIDITYTVTVLQHNTDAELLHGLIREICRVTREKVYLFEDTSPKIVTRESFVVRPIEYYQAIVDQNDFKLTQIKYITQYFSYWTTSAINKIMTHRNFREGEPISSANSICQKSALRVTNLLDRLFTYNKGLTKMLFESKM